MDIRNFIEEITRGAGEITLNYFNKPGLKVDNKENNTPVTLADREAEQFLRARIKKAFPDDGIVGEEFGVEEGKSGRRWILDPLDGTKTFIHGVPLYGTLVALEEASEIVAGCAFMPATNEIISAVRGEGAIYNGQPARVSEISTISEATLLTTDDYSLRKRIGQARHLELFEEAKLFRTWGDCYGHFLVATGRAEAMLDSRVSAWDIAPFAVIIEEAGGKYADFKKQRTHQSSSFISSNTAIHDQLMYLAVTEYEYA